MTARIGKENAMFCKNCGSEIQEETNFCPKCGTKVENTPQENAALSNTAISTPIETAKRRKKTWLIPCMILLAALAALAVWKFVLNRETPDSRFVGKWTVYATKGKDDESYIFSSNLTSDEKQVLDTSYFVFDENHTGKIVVLGMVTKPLTWEYLHTSQDDTDCVDTYNIAIETDTGTNEITATLVRTKDSAINGMILITNGDTVAVLEKDDSSGASESTPKNSTGKSVVGTASSRGKSSSSAAEKATSGEKNALKRAKEYLDYTAFSYTGLIEQLEYEGYSNSEATYAVKNCGADWNEQAVKKAKQYLEYSAFSKDSLTEQLEYEGFTHEQAVYGVNKSY